MKNILLFFLIVITFDLHSQNKVIDFWFSTYEYFSFDDTSFIDYILFEGDVNIWQIGKPQKKIINSSYSGEKCLITDTSDYYGINDTSRFSFRVTHFENAITINFMHKYDTDSLNDGGTIEYSLNNGKDWKNALWLWDSCFNSSSFPEIDSISAGNIIGLTGRQSDWSSFNMNLAFETDCFPGADPYDTVTIRFSFFSDGIQNNKEGWAIDNLSIGWYRVGIDEIKNKNIVLYIYPMPISEESVLFIDNFYSKESYIKVYNIWGNLLFEENLDSYNFPIGKYLNNLKKGIYILKYQNKNGITLSKKIMK